MISELRRLYIKEGLLPVTISQMVGAAFTIRNASDYEDMFIASREETETQLENARYVYEKIKVYIDAEIK